MSYHNHVYMVDFLICFVICTSYQLMVRVDGTIYFYNDSIDMAY